MGQLQLLPGAGLAAELLGTANDPAYVHALGAYACEAIGGEFDKPFAMARWRYTLRDAQIKYQVANNE